MSTPFDLMTPAKSGFLGLVADKSLDKKRRGEVMAGAAIVFGPANTGRANFEISTPSDPANGLILMSDPARMAPRGSAGSWTFAVPVIATPTGWRPLETAGDEDKDFLTVKAKVLGSGKGVMVNTTGHANGEPVVILSSPLVAHHRGLTPPVQSAEVFDVNAKGELDGDVHGKLHYALYLTPFPRAFCSALPPGIPGGTVLPQYQSGPVTGPATHYAPILNFTRNGDGTPSYGPLHFENSEACASDEVNGPLCPAVDIVAANHRLASTVGGKPVYSAGIDLSRALFGLPSGKNLAGVWFETALTGTLFSPLDFNPNPYHPGTIGTYFRPVELREDFKAFHFNGCGIKVPGTKKWLTTVDKQNYPTTPYPSPLPIGYGKGPETGGGGSGGGSGSDGDGGAAAGFGVASAREAASRASLGLPITGIYPTLTGPHTEEAPGYRGMVRPNAIDPPSGTGFPNGTTGSWRDSFGFDEYDFLTTPRGPHRVTLPVYLNASPILTTGTLRWPTQFDVAPSMRAGPDGRWYGERGYGKTVEVVMPGVLEAHNAYKARHGELLPSAYTPSAGMVLLNYKTVSSAKIVETVFGLGCLHPQSNKPASGVLHKLTYAGAGLTTDPDYEIVPTDATGAESTLNGGGAAMRVYHHLTPENEITLNNSTNIAAGNNVSAPLATIVRITSGTTLTGIDAPVPARKRVIWLVNHSGAAVTISHDATSTAANRFYCPESGDYTLEDHSGATVYYDVTLSRWCLFDTAGGGGAGGGVTGAARAYLSGADQAYTTGSPAQIQFNAETFDVEGWFDSTTNYRYTPLDAGKYRISARCRSNAALTTDNPVIIIYKNGSEYARGNSGEGGVGRSGSVVDSTVDMNGTTDYLEIYFNSGANCTIYLGSAETYVDVERLDLPAVATFTDAPSDGNTYGRNNAAWDAVRRSDVTAQQAATFVLENRTSDPGAPATGQMWFRTDL